MKALLSISAGLVVLAAPMATQAQIATPAASPKSTITQRVGLTDITLTYSRPSVKGRMVFGDSTSKAIVPYAKRWRTGANQTTTVKFSDDVTVEGKKVPAGEYGLYTVPGKASWKMVLSKNTKQGANVDGFKAEDDVATFMVKPYKTAATVETFTMNFTDLTPATANVDLQWETTGVKFKVAADVEPKVMAQIAEKVTQNASPTPNDLAAAAVYYYDNDKDLKQALAWMQKANEKEPKFWNVHTEAKIRMKMKDYKGALTAAEQSRTLAQTAKNMDYVKMNDDIIATAKKNGAK
ncbi:DUF2911 domain-containing protein [Hymenobacter canadensis]|uniref:DUF2911 domain-containing protein n=1 Tax=Hymenobacter canadensis TaxID=2999067 RepID=A0ABY7LNW1_9BACT|nr:DUF2911 domain-containing protein [Hymenobacter canadensis]WBA42110.1 DUF2911 domain-containing protein [Hymenobacter canadensis]